MAGRAVGFNAEVRTRLPTCALPDVVSRVNKGDGKCGARTAAAARVAVLGSAITKGLCKTVLGSGLIVFDISMSASAGMGVMVAIAILRPSPSMRAVFMFKAQWSPLRWLI